MDTQFARRVRADFPILQTQMAGKPLAYFDNGATTQKPQPVIDALVKFYSEDNANIHRGVYELSQRATDQYEAARQTIADFIGANDVAECIFVRGTTEAINLVASSWGRANLSQADQVIVSGLEHHSNIVPWQFACEATGAELVVWQPDEQGDLDCRQLEEIITDRTQMVAVQHVSNALGTIHEIDRIVEIAHDNNSLVMVDGAQWVGHNPTDVSALGCDFYTFSGHKLFAPTGIGLLWGRRDLLEKMPPFQGGGDMIETVAFEKTTFAPLPSRFEAGTPNIGGAIALATAADYVTEIGFEQIHAQEQALLAYADKRLSEVPGLRVLGSNRSKEAVISFVMEAPNVAPLDIAMHLSKDGIAIRTGHHCCMPLMGHLQVSGTCRVSMAFYNTADEVDRLVESLIELAADRMEKQSKRSESASGETVGSGDSADQEITFAVASEASPCDAGEKLAEEFLMFDDPESKTELLLELGQELPDDFARLKQLTTAVPGCMSEVYLVGRPMPDAPERFEFAADSNAEVVRGLIAVLSQLFSGQKATEILEFDFAGYLRKIGLDSFVSAQRRSGLEGMVRRIHTLATAITERQNT
ncbi:MAG TPA: SufS family cysteine desulfurase [Planctomycetaceae bacterium]|nr:SufS family cysteine desulfurase [Planctomycetaceae bacterium]